MARKYDVFLSHSHADKLRVHELASELKKIGVRVFLDEHKVGAGDSLYSSLSEALAQSEYVVFCVSKDSIESPWVEREVASALARQVKERRKRILPVLLDDTPVPILLSDFVWLDLRTNSAEQVAMQIKSAVQSTHDHAPRTTPYPRGLVEQVDSALALLAGETAAPGFCWAIVSGPSSAGKDVLSYVAIQHLQASHGLSFLKKITTRPRRPSEPVYVTQVADAEFERMFRAGEIMFPFKKRDVRYGFDARQFRESLSEGTPLLSIFTEFNLVPALTETMNSIGIRTAAFFIETEKADVLRRVMFRNLPDYEVKSRMVSIDQDYELLAHRSTFRSEYVFINNGDGVSFRDASEALTGSIRLLIEGKRESHTEK